MTCCLIASLPGVVIAAADTRITLHHSSNQTHMHDGPADLRVDVASLGRTVVMPYRYRKVRYLNAGWAVVAGEFASGTLLLDALKATSSATFQEAQERLSQVQMSLESSAESTTGIAPDQLRETVVIGAALNSGQGTWSLGMSARPGRTNPSAGDYAVNYPIDVPSHVQQSANRTLEHELTAAHSAQNGIGLVKAAVKLIAVSAEHSAHVSRRVQVGITISDPRGGHVARYFDGSTEELLRLVPSSFFPSSEPAA